MLVIWKSLYSNQFLHKSEDYTANQTVQYLNQTLLHKYYSKSGMVFFEADDVSSTTITQNNFN